ncbi:MAG: DUF4810 domain-containing protein [Paraglaciecola sp.]|uniref:DUF4810 domain-containing protein n=1 Tax=Paraglaciecola sp. TaxID=1920173 RepID=UPI0032973F71
MKLIITITIFILTLVGCKSTETIYYHGGYPSAVYQYLKNDDLSLDQQIEALNLIIENAANQSKPVMPGVHSHLGLLYFDTGNNNLGTHHFNTEKSLFPESSTYLDFLLNQNQQVNGSNE